MSKYTEEQRAVIESKADSLVVNAFAGTGKTTMLVGFAEARPRSRILYLAFNKAVAEEAKARFPSNVDAKTSHSLAFAGFGSRYKNKLGNPRAFHARNVLRPRMASDEGLVFSGLALEAVNRFLASSATEINQNHVSLNAVLARGHDPAEVLSGARRLWAAMQNPDEHEMPMPHDGYLKLFQLSSPSLSRYDYILLDEAQDTNPCLFDVFSAQETGRVLVGDQHQNIYSFRGAMNAMKRMKGERHALTGSFRFGEAVAEAANAMLAIFKEEEVKVRGLGAESALGSKREGLDTIYLHRTNAGLFDRAVELMQGDARIHFVGGIRNYNFETILDAWRVMDGDQKSVRDPFMKSFGSFVEMESYADSVEDRELKARLKVVSKYTFRIPRLIERLEAIEQPDASKADASLTTAHKSKGLEWDQVVLGDDFPDLLHESRFPLAERFFPPQIKEVSPLSDEEANLIYVAATRAKKNLVPTQEMSLLLNWYRRNQQKLQPH